MSHKFWTLAAILASLASNTARAQTGSFGDWLAWSAPLECPSEDRLVSEVERLLGEALLPALAQRRLRVGVQLTGSEASEFRMLLSFQTETSRSSRSLSFRDCAKLTDAGALIVALTVDPDRMSARQALVGEAPATRLPTPGEATAAMPSPGPAAGAAATAAPATPPVVPRAVATPRAALAPPAKRRKSPTRLEPGDIPPELLPETGDSPLRYTVGIKAQLGIGILPAAAPGLGVSGGIHLERWSLLLGGDLWPNQQAAVPFQAGGAIDLSLIALGLRLCWAPLLGRSALHLCGGPDVGDMAAQGVGIDRPRLEHDRWSSLNLGLLFEQQAGDPLVLSLGAEVGFALERPRFGVTIGGSPAEVYQPVGLSTRLWLGFAFSDRSQMNSRAAGD